MKETISTTNQKIRATARVPDAFEEVQGRLRRAWTRYLARTKNPRNAALLYVQAAYIDAMTTPLLTSEPAPMTPSRSSYRRAGRSLGFISKQQKTSAITHAFSRMNGPRNCNCIRQSQRIASALHRLVKTIVGVDNLEATLEYTLTTRRIEEQAGIFSILPQSPLYSFRT